MKNHFPILDTIRGLAILFVVSCHYFLKTGIGIELLTGNLWIGVDLFFVLSGFLITKSINDSLNQKDYFKKFYLKRILRIIPLYYLILLITYFWVSFSQFGIDKTLFPYTYLFFISNYFIITESGWLGGVLLPTWSLSVEEQFYLIWPIFIYFVNIKIRNNVTFLICLFALLFRIYLSSIPNLGWGYAYVWLPSRIDSLCIGALIAFSLTDHHLKKLIYKYQFVCISSALFFILLSIFYFGYLSRHRVGWPLLYLSLNFIFGYLVFFSVNFNRDWKGISILNLFGKYSYSIYLIHSFLISILHYILNKNLLYIYIFPFFLLVLLLIGYISWTFFELPFIKLNKFFI